MSGGVGGVEVHDGGDNVDAAGGMEDDPATFMSFSVQLRALAGRPRFR